RCFEHAKRHKAYQLSLNELEQQQLVASLENIQTELSRQQTGYRQAVQLHVQHILLLFGRLTSATKAESGQRFSSSLPGWMAEIWTYIDENMEQLLGLSKLAERAA